MEYLENVGKMQNLLNLSIMRRGSFANSAVEIRKSIEKDSVKAMMRPTQVKDKEMVIERTDVVTHS